MRFYLAGKISANDWRHSIVSRLRETSSADYEDHPTNGRLEPGLTLPGRWPILHAAVVDSHDYCGPYFISDDHSCYHGRNSHGNGEGCMGPVWSPCDIHNTVNCYPDMLETELNERIRILKREAIVNLCFQAIAQCDVVFAWISDVTAYGTLVELGYAAANHKDIWLAFPPHFYELEDLWFAQYCGVKDVQMAHTPKEAFDTLLARQAPTSGYVYILRSGEHYKIGKSANVDRRLSQISPKTPLPVELIHTIATNNMTLFESILHHKYAKYRVNGEWFALPDRVVEWMQERVYLWHSQGDIQMIEEGPDA